MIVCLNYDKKPVPEWCDEAEKPGEEQKCNVEPCLSMIFPILLFIFIIFVNFTFWALATRIKLSEHVPNFCDGKFWKCRNEILKRNGFL